MIKLQHVYKSYRQDVARKLQQQLPQGAVSSQVVDDGAVAVQQASKAQLVKKHLPEGSLVLDDICLQVEAGEIFAVIGKSGAGKSTLLRLLNRLENPDAGQVIIDGHDLSELKAAELRRLRRQVGVIFQHFNLINVRDVFENVALPLQVAGVDKKEISSRVHEFLQLVDLEDKIHAYPDELSGGQKQRVAIARALVTRPKILLCDEATSALDAQSTVQVLNLLSKINKTLQLTIFLITHELDVVRRICHRVAVMDAGIIVEEGETLQTFLKPQHPLTKSLLAHDVERIEPEAEARLHRHEKGRIPAADKEQAASLSAEEKKKVNLRLRYLGHETNEPVLSEIQRLYGVSSNILQAKIESIAGAAVGYMLCTFMGPPEALSKAVSFLTEQGIDVEEIKNENE